MQRHANGRGEYQAAVTQHLFIRAGDNRWNAGPALGIRPASGRYGYGAAGQRGPSGGWAEIGRWLVTLTLTLTLALTLTLTLTLS